MMEDKSIYVEIESSVSVRRDILEGATESLKLLKDLEESKNKSDEEERMFKKFKTHLTHIRANSSKFEELLPKVIEEGIIKKEETKKEAKINKKPEPKTEIDALKDEIDSIERKLKAL